MSDNQLQVVNADDKADDDTVPPADEAVADGHDHDAVADGHDHDAVAAGHDHDAVAAGEDRPARTRGAGAALIARIRRHLVAIGLAVVLIAALAVTGWIYVTQYRADQQTDPAAAGIAIKAASDGTVALLSYAPETLDNDFASAKSHLTGDFLNYYTTFTTDVVKPAATQKSVKTTASVTQSAVSELRPDSAQVLLFINQTTTSQENPNGAFAASSVKVGLTKVDGNWLISSFDPV